VYCCCDAHFLYLNYSPAKFTSLASAPVVNGKSEEKSGITSNVPFLPTTNKLDFATLAQQSSPFGYSKFHTILPGITVYA
jgi:hypothetical protein